MLAVGGGCEEVVGVDSEGRERCRGDAECAGCCRGKVKYAICENGVECFGKICKRVFTSMPFCSSNLTLNLLHHDLGTQQDQFTWRDKQASISSKRDQTHR